MKSTQSTSSQDNNNAVDSSNGSPKVPPLRIVFSTTSASGSIGANAANVDHTYSSSGDSTATSTGAEETSVVKSRKRQKIGNSDVTTSCSSSSTSGRGLNTSQTSVSSTPSVGTKKHHHHHHHHHHQHHRTSSSCSSSSSSTGSKKKHSSSSSDSEEDMNAEQSSERNEATAAGNGMTSPKSSSSSNAPSSSNAVSSKPTSPASNQSEPKVPSLRIVISSSGSTSGSTSATSSVSQSTSDINKVSSSNTLSGQSSTSSKNLPYVVSSSTTAADPNEEVGTSEYEMSALSGVSTSANVSTSGRVTRSSQRAAQQQQQKGDGDSERHSTSPTSTSSSLGKRDSSVKETVEPNQASAAGGSGSVKDEKSELKDQMPRKRKLRNKQPNQNQQGNKQASEQDEDNESTSSSTSSGVGGANCGSTSAVSTEKELKNAKEFQMPSYNCYHMYLNIRKQVDKRRRQMFPVQPKAPQGFKDYLLNKGSYLLEGKLCLPDSAGNGKNVPVMAPPPAILKPGTGLYNLHIDQERTRHKLRLRHLIEREKLQLSTEQEVLRVHGRAALAMANQSVPFSVCTILKDEEIYNTIESESDSTSTESVQNSSASNVSRNEYQRTTYTTSANNTNSATDLVTLTGNPGGPGARSRYNGRLFISWLQDVDDKWEKIKADTISRQKRESESLHAIQKLEWEWKMKEVGACDVKTSPLIDDTLVPAVQVSEDFDLLPV